MTGGDHHELAAAGDTFAASELLEIDSNDTDSAIDDMEDMSIDTSVRSSVYDFVEENGRRYHRYKEGLYFFPNDESEQERLDLQHQLFLMTFENRLSLAPTGDKVLHNVLDIGTGTGIWAIDFAMRNPSAHVIGTDLSPIQPDFVPPNCSFEIDDAEDPWIFSQSFDLIHARALVSCFRSPQTVIDSAAASLAPGGWLEFQDLIVPMHCLDSSWDGSDLKRWSYLLVDCAYRVGIDMSNSTRYADMFRAAGLVDVEERRFVWPSNSWVRGKRMKRLATWFRKDISDGLEGLSLRLLMGVGGMSREEVDSLVKGVKRDLADTKLHCFMPVVVCLGRKPA